MAYQVQHQFKGREDEAALLSRKLATDTFIAEPGAFKSVYLGGFGQEVFRLSGINKRAPPTLSDVDSEDVKLMSTTSSAPEVVSHCQHSHSPGPGAFSALTMEAMLDQRSMAIMHPVEALRKIIWMSLADSLRLLRRLPLPPILAQTFLGSEEPTHGYQYSSFFFPAIVLFVLLGVEDVEDSGEAGLSLFRAGLSEGESIWES
ncbi:hypothetical protein PG985_000605 [Apiospora marii]|uniref:Uncharacterized protein n=1 Tax=Apiospora marii TaxID=335849 RepID=A0ABR1R2G4_9PEZI